MDDLVELVLRFQGVSMWRKQEDTKENLTSLPTLLSVLFAAKKSCWPLRRGQITALKSIGDIIDESLKSLLKQSKLFTSQLESNGLMTIISTLADDK